MVGEDNRMIKARKLNVEVEDGSVVLRTAIGCRLSVYLVVIANVCSLHSLNLAKDHLIEPFVLGEFTHLMLFQQTLQSFQLGSSLAVLVIRKESIVVLAAAATLGRGGPRSGRVGKGVSLLVPPETTLLPAFPQGAMFVKEGDGGTSEGDVMASCTVVASG